MGPTAVAALVGTGIGFLTLTVTVIVLFTKIGRLIGGLEAVVQMLTEKTTDNNGLIVKNADDIDRLWAHQRVTDTTMGQCMTLIESTGKQVSQLHDHFLGKGLQA